MYKRKSLNYIEESDLYFSQLYGDGIYGWTGDYVPDPTDPSGRRRCPSFVDVETGDLFYGKRVLLNRYLAQYMRGIVAAPEIDNVIWPVDLITLHEETEFAENYLEHMFGLTAEDSEEMLRDPDYPPNNMLLFPIQDYAIQRTVADELKEARELSWKNPRIRGLLGRLADAFCALNEKGYLCLDIDPRHLYVRGDQRIVFEYSDLVFRNPDSGEELHPNERTLLKPGEYPVEYVPSTLVRGGAAYPAGGHQNYSLTAFFFYLMIGRLPCEGPLLEGLTDNNPDEHEQKFKVYHENPVFIFDPEDDSNHLGAFASDQRVIGLWQELPQPIRKAFLHTLRTRAKEVPPSAAAWRELLADDRTNREGLVQAQDGIASKGGE